MPASRCLFGNLKSLFTLPKGHFDTFKKDFRRGQCLAEPVNLFFQQIF